MVEFFFFFFFLVHIIIPGQCMWIYCYTHLGSLLWCQGCCLLSVFTPNKLFQHLADKVRTIPISGSSQNQQQTCPCLINSWIGLRRVWGYPLWTYNSLSRGKLINLCLCFHLIDIRIVPIYTYLLDFVCDTTLPA